MDIFVIMVCFSAIMSVITCIESIIIFNHQNKPFDNFINPALSLIITCSCAIAILRNCVNPILHGTQPDTTISIVYMIIGFVASIEFSHHVNKLLIEQGEI